MRSFLLLMSVLVAAGIGALGPVAPAAATPNAAGVPVLVQQTETPPVSTTDPESGTDAESDAGRETDGEKSRRKLVVGLVALGLLVIVLWGRRIRKNRYQWPTY